MCINNNLIHKAVSDVKKKKVEPNCHEGQIGRLYSVILCVICASVLTKKMNKAQITLEKLSSTFLPQKRVKS